MWCGVQVGDVICRSGHVAASSGGSLLAEGRGEEAASLSSLSRRRRWSWSRCFAERLLIFLLRDFTTFAELREIAVADRLMARLEDVLVDARPGELG